MTRNEIYNEWARANVTANGAFARDDEVQRAYTAWCYEGQPRNVTIHMFRAVDRDLVTIDRAVPKPVELDGGVDLSGDAEPFGGEEL